MIETTATTELRIQEYLIALNAIAPEGYSFDTTQGKKYTKVVMTVRGGQRSVHSFIDPVTGAIYKPAGWARPAEHVRFCLTSEASYARLMEALKVRNAWAGGYLYIR